MCRNELWLWDPLVLSPNLKAMTDSRLEWLQSWTGKSEVILLKWPGIIVQDSGSTLKQRSLYSATYILGGIHGPDIHILKGMPKLIMIPSDSLWDIASYPC